MLKVHHISKSFDITTILKDVTFTLNAGERLALVGPNGCGKTTLLRILIGEEKPDTGSVGWVIPTMRIGYLPQGFGWQPGETFGEFIRRMEGDLDILANQLEALAHALAANPDQPEVQQAYEAVLAQMEQAAENTGRSAETLAALGLANIPNDLPVSALSGGQKTRLSLAGILLSAPQVLLLDEPTNHLDIAMLEWLEDWLKQYRGALLVVSHDRAFLDGVATGILEIEPITRTLRAYSGNYSDYMEQKAAERNKQWQQYSDQQEEISQLTSAARHVRKIASFRKGGKGDSGDKFAAGFFGNRAKNTVGRAKQIEARIDKLLGEDHIDKPGRTWQMKMEFQDTPASGRDVLAMDNLSVGYNGIPLLDHIQHTLRFGERAALIGPNGSGKTTLIRTIIGQLEPVSGTYRLGSSVRLGYMAQEQEILDPAQTPLSTLQGILSQNETEVRNFLHYFLFGGDDVFKRNALLSYGERARLMLACLVAQGCNFLILDEPINHLDIPARARFEQALTNFEGTVLAVVHDRYFIENFASEVWEVRGSDLHIHRRAIEED